MGDVDSSIDLSPTISIDHKSNGEDQKTLYRVLRNFSAGIFSADSEDLPAPSLVERVKRAFEEQAPHLREASRNSGRDLVDWMREGSALRALLVSSVGTITLFALSGVLAFTLFLLVATLNAIIISALVSLAAVGGFLAIFFTCLTAFYIGALSVAIFAISATTISMIIAVLVAAGWIVFFWVVWLAAKKSMDLTKQSLKFTSSVISAYSNSREVKDESSKAIFLEVH